jgi:hypothetical protein
VHTIIVTRILFVVLGLLDCLGFGGIGASLFGHFHSRYVLTCLLVSAVSFCAGQFVRSLFALACRIESARICGVGFGAGVASFGSGYEHFAVDDVSAAADRPEQLYGRRHIEQSGADWN